MDAYEPTSEKLRKHLVTKLDAVLLHTNVTVIDSEHADLVATKLICACAHASRKPTRLADMEFVQNEFGFDGELVEGEVIYQVSYSEEAPDIILLVDNAGGDVYRRTVLLSNGGMTADVMSSEIINGIKRFT